MNKLIKILLRIVALPFLLVVFLLAKIRDAVAFSYEWVTTGGIVVTNKSAKREEGRRIVEADAKFMGKPAGFWIELLAQSRSNGTEDLIMRNYLLDRELRTLKNQLDFVNS